MDPKFTPEVRRRIAAQVSIDVAYLYQCLSGRRDIDPTEAVRIERESGGFVTRFDVCKKRGTQIWPELHAQRAIVAPQQPQDLQVV